VVLAVVLDQPWLWAPPMAPSMAPGSWKRPEALMKPWDEPGTLTSLGPPKAAMEGGRASMASV